MTWLFVAEIKVGLDLFRLIRVFKHISPSQLSAYCASANLFSRGASISIAAG